MDIPAYTDLMNPVLNALIELGGSGSLREIDSQVISSLNLSESQINVLHKPGRSSQTEIEYRLAWARTYLKKYGLLDNSARGIWVFTGDTAALPVNPDDVRRFVAEQQKNKNDKTPVVEIVVNDMEEELVETVDQRTWEEELHQTLLALEPSAFERLTQFVLRESGFDDVHVSGRTGDGGIDGHGTLIINGLITFRVIFQCKRYTGSVGSPAIRDFQGTVVGRADRGLFVTTGRFTAEAEAAAVRDGAPRIDLMDGAALIRKLRELEIGVKVTTRVVETVMVSVDQEFFTKI